MFFFFMNETKKRDQIRLSWSAIVRNLTQVIISPTPLI